MNGLFSSPEWFDGVTLEGQVLLHCCHTDLSSQTIETLKQLLARPVNWPQFKQLAQYHGVVPLVSKALHQLSSSNIPTEILYEFSTYVQASLVLKRLILEEMLTISKAFSQEEVKVVPFKGPILALSVYKSLELREFLDLDLLIKPSQIKKAQAILVTLGYTRRGNQEPSEGGSPSLYHNFTKCNGMFLVDLQIGIRGANFFFSLDHKIFWNNLEVFRIKGQEVLTFTPEILLIILCLHGTKHVWATAKWIGDIAELLRKNPQLDWSQVENLSGEMHCFRQVLMGICLAHQMFAIPLPPTIHRRIQNDKDILRLSYGIPSSLIHNPKHQVHEKHRKAFFLSLKETNGERLRYALQICAHKSPVIHESLSWFRFQGRLQALNRVYGFLLQVLPFKKLQKFIHDKLFPHNE